MGLISLARPLEVADGGRALQAAERVAVAVAVERRQGRAEQDQIGQHRSRICVAARAAEQVAVLALDLAAGQRPGQAEAGRLVGQRAVLPQPALDLAGAVAVSWRCTGPRSSASARRPRGRRRGAAPGS